MSKSEAIASKKQKPFNLTMHFLTEYSAKHTTINYILANKVFHIPKLVSHRFGGYKYPPQEIQLISKIQYKMLAKATLFVAKNRPTSRPTDEENIELHKQQVVDTFNKRFKILSRFFKIPFEQINKHLEKDLIRWVIQTTNDRLFVGHEFNHKSTLLENVDDAVLLIGLYEKSFNLLDYLFDDQNNLDYIALKKQLLGTMLHLTDCLLDPSMTKKIIKSNISTFQTIKEKLIGQLEEVNTLFVEKYAEVMQSKNRAEYALYDQASQKFFKDKRGLIDKVKKEFKLKLTKNERDEEIKAYNSEIGDHTTSWTEELKKIKGLRDLLLYGHRKLAATEITSIVEMNSRYIYTNGFIDELFLTRDLFTLRLKELLEYNDTKYGGFLSNTLAEFFTALKTLAIQKKIRIDIAKRKKNIGLWQVFLSLFSSKNPPDEDLMEIDSSRETSLKLAAYERLKDLVFLIDKDGFTRADHLVDIAILYAERNCARKDYKEDIEDLIERAQEITKFGKRKPYAEMLFKYIMREGKSWSPFLTMAIMFEYKEILDSLPPREIHETINGENGEWMLILRDVVINKKLTTPKHLKNLLKYSK